MRDFDVHEREKDRHKKKKQKKRKKQKQKKQKKKTKKKASHDEQRHTRDIGDQFQAKLPRVEQPLEVGVAAAAAVATTLILHAALDAFARLENLRVRAESTDHREMEEWSHEIRA